ncbi:MAG: hypothetical protein R3C11_11390 [Planctomycetaceae bacterium]
MLRTCERLFEQFMETWLTAGLTDYMALGVAIVFIAWSINFFNSK